METNQTVCSRLEQRSVTYVLMAEKCKPCEIYRIICDMYKEVCFLVKKKKYLQMS